MDPRPETEALEQTRQEHVGRLLLRASSAFNAQALRRLHALGHAALTPAHLNLLPHLDAAGTRIVALAGRAGMSKQAAGGLVAELEGHGYLTRGPDPTDGRAVRVQFTEAGWKYLRDAQEVKQSMEAEYRSRLGDAAWEALNAALRRLLGGPEPE